MQISSAENIIEFIHHEQLIGLWDWNIPTREKYMSPAFKKMLGYDDHEIINHADIWLQLIAKEDQQLVINAYQQHVASRGALVYENTVRYVHKGGKTIYILSKGKVTEWDFLGNPLRMKGYYINVTQQLKEISYLQQENEQLKLLASAIKPLPWQWNIKTGDISWSDAFYAATGYTKQDIKPSFFTFFHVLINNADSERLKKLIDSHIKNEVPFKTTATIKHKGGKQVLYEIGGKLKRDKNKEPYILYGYVIEKEPNSDNAQTSLLLHEKNKYTSGGEWLYDLANETVVWSKGVYALFELPENYQPGFERLPELYDEASRQKLQSALKEAVYYKKAYQLQLLCITAGGTKKWVRETGNPVIDNEGNLTGVHGVIEDIDESKRKEIALEEANSRLTERNKRLLNFAQIAAHNLQTHASNLSATLKHIEIAKNDAEKNFFMQAISKVSDSFNKTLAGLNELVTIEGGAQENKQVVYFETVFDNVKKSLATAIAETGAIISADFSKCPYVHFVPAYLESILYNLIGNAIKYRQANVTPYIVLKTTIKNNQQQLTVKDNGRGINMDKYGDKVFGLYKTFHSNPDAHGIGLFMTKNQVEAMGGSIEVESEPGLGTTFTIYFNHPGND